jgi:hypothetical protein
MNRIYLRPNKFFDYILNIYGHATLPILLGVGAASACFLILLAFHLDGKTLGWNHSFLYFTLCVAWTVAIRRRSITQKVFREKFEQIYDLQTRGSLKKYEYNYLSSELLRAYIQLNTGPVKTRTSVRVRPQEGVPQLGNVIAIYVTDGLGAGFASYLVVFLCIVRLKRTPDDVLISKELMVFCLSAIWVAVFTFIGLSQKSFEKKMKFIKFLFDKTYISSIQYQIAVQSIMGWYSTGQYGLAPESPGEPAVG